MYTPYERSKKMKTSTEYRNQAWATLTGNCNGWALASLIIAIASGCCAWTNVVFPTYSMMTYLTQGISLLIAILLAQPLQFAYSAVMLDQVRGCDLNEESAISRMWHQFLDDYERYVLSGALVLIVVFATAVITLGIAGIIFSLAYALVPYILKDNPEMAPKEALYLSRMMMRGHKAELFVLMLTFIGWVLLGLLTCGIGYLWLSPYVNMSITHFYEDVKIDYLSESQDNEAVTNE